MSVVDPVVLQRLVEEYRRSVEAKLDEAFDAVVALEQQLDPNLEPGQREAANSMMRAIHMQVKREVQR